MSNVRKILTDRKIVKSKTIFTKYLNINIIYLFSLPFSGFHPKTKNEIWHIGMFFVRVVV